MMMEVLVVSLLPLIKLQLILKVDMVKQVMHTTTMVYNNKHLVWLEGQHIGSHSQTHRMVVIL